MDYFTADTLLNGPTTLGIVISIANKGVLDPQSPLLADWYSKFHSKLNSVLRDLLLLSTRDELLEIKDQITSMNEWSGENHFIFDRIISGAEPEPPKKRCRRRAFNANSTTFIDTVWIGLGCLGLLIGGIYYQRSLQSE